VIQSKLEHVSLSAKEAAVPVPDIPPGFDFTDPEIYATRVPNEELAELRRAAPV